MLSKADENWIAVTRDIFVSSGFEGAIITLAYSITLSGKARRQDVYPGECQNKITKKSYI